MKLRRKVDELWSRMWTQLNSCRQTKHFFPTINKKRSFELINTDRKLFGRLAQLYSGHGFLNRHEFLVYGKDNEEYDPMCQYCDHNYEQTTEHIIGWCPFFLGLRQEIFGCLYKDPPFDFPTSKVVRFLRESGIMALQWESKVDNSQNSS